MILLGGTKPDTAELTRCPSPCVVVSLEINNVYSSLADLDFGTDSFWRELELVVARHRVLITLTLALT
jgi:hypothetical protein